jgi:hypothetical protein
MIVKPVRNAMIGRSPKWLIGCISAFLVAVLTYLGVSGWQLCNDFRDKFRVAVLKEVAQSFESLEVLSEFEIDLRESNLESAYALTTNEYQHNHNLKTFADSIQVHHLSEARWIESKGLASQGDCCSYAITAEHQDKRRVTFRLGLSKVDGKWKVNDILIP